VIPARSSAEACTKISLPPRSEATKPNPFVALYHLTVPDSSTAAPLAGGYADRSGRPRLVGFDCAVLLSTLRISVTCGLLGPGPARTSSVAPGDTLSWPLRSTTLTCRKASPDPCASWTKPNPFSGLYHLTTACAGVVQNYRHRSTATGRAKISVSVAHFGFLEDGTFLNLK
jgi:hypothetical protein